MILKLEASILPVIKPKMWIPYSLLLEFCADDVDQKDDESSTTKACSSENETPPKLWWITRVPADQLNCSLKCLTNRSIHLALQVETTDQSFSTTVSPTVNKCEHSLFDL